MVTCSASASGASSTLCVHKKHRTTDFIPARHPALYSMRQIVCRRMELPQHHCELNSYCSYSTWPGGYSGYWQVSCNIGNLCVNQYENREGMCRGNLAHDFDTHTFRLVAVGIVLRDLYDSWPTALQDALMLPNITCHSKFSVHQQSWHE